MKNMEQRGATNQETIQASFIGYQTKEVTVGSQSTIDFALNVEVSELDEVVVIGYGSVQKKDLTGAVAPVSDKDFNKGVLTSPEGLLSGKIAGVQITPNSGEPGAAPKITIRGRATLGGGGSDDAPLFVIDGVPVDNNGTVGSRNPLSFLNLNDIGNITVLKDASATAIYGSRGAHGVIIVTTKKGSYNQKSTLTYDAGFTISQNIGDFGNLSPNNFRAFMMLKGGIRLDKLGDSETVWMDEILRDATGQTHNITMRGGSKDNNYRISIGHQKIDGIVKSSSTERTTFAFNFTQKLLNDNLTLTLNSRTGFTKDRFSPDVVGSAFSFDPTQSVYGVDSLYAGYFEWSDGLAVKNPVAEIELNQNGGEGIRSLSNIELEYKVPQIEGLSLKTNLSFDARNSENKLFRPKDLRAETLAGNPGNYKAENEKRQSLLGEFYSTYKKDLNQIKSAFDITLGYSYQEFVNEKPFYSLTGLEVDLFEDDAPVSAFRTDVGLSPVRNRIISFFGRMNYTFADRYILTATLRRDGSTKFGGSNRWGLFPSAAFKWQLIDEPFLESQSLFEELGLRVGIGTTGSQEIPDYLYVTTYGLSVVGAKYQFGDNYYSLWRPEPVDPNIRWEETRSINAGIDFALSGGRISGSLDFYEKNTSGLLFVVFDYAGTFPGDKRLKNVGQVKNSGVELMINAVVLDNTNFKWNTSFNVSYNKNKILKIDNDEANAGSTIYEVGSISGDVGQTGQALKVEEEVNSFYFFEQKYLNGKPVDDQTDANGDGMASLLDMYVDQNDDKIINELDKRSYKSPMPDWTMGWTSSLSYKNFDLNTTFRANLGNYVYNNVASSQGNIQRLIDRVPNNVHKSVLETNFNAKQLHSDYYVENASFLKLDNVSLAYNLKMSESTSLRLSATMTNVFTLTGYSGQDPEISNGLDNNLYPFSRTMIFGATLNF